MSDDAAEEPYWFKRTEDGRLEVNPAIPAMFEAVQRAVAGMLPAERQEDA